MKRFLSIVMAVAVTLTSLAVPVFAATETTVVEEIVLINETTGSQDANGTHMSFGKVASTQNGGASGFTDAANSITTFGTTEHNGKLSYKMTAHPKTNGQYYWNPLFGIGMNSLWNGETIPGTEKTFGLTADNYTDAVLKMSICFEGEGTKRGVDADAYKVGLGYRVNVNSDYKLPNSLPASQTIIDAKVGIKSYLPSNYTTGVWYDIEVPLSALTSVLPEGWSWEKEALVEFEANTAGLGSNSTDYATEMYVTNLKVVKYQTTEVADGAYDDFASVDGITLSTLGFAKQNASDDIEVILANETTGSQDADGNHMSFGKVASTQNGGAGGFTDAANSITTFGTTEHNGKLSYKMTAHPKANGHYYWNPLFGIGMNSLWNGETTPGTEKTFGLTADNYTDAVLKMSICFEGEGTKRGVDAGAYMVGLGYRVDVSGNYELPGMPPSTSKIIDAKIGIKDYLPSNYTTGTWYDIEVPLRDLTSVLPEGWSWEKEALVEFAAETDGLGSDSEDYATEMYVTNLKVVRPSVNTKKVVLVDESTGSKDASGVDRSFGRDMVWYNGNASYDPDCADAIDIRAINSNFGKYSYKITAHPGEDGGYFMNPRFVIAANSAWKNETFVDTMRKFGLNADNYQASTLKLTVRFEGESTKRGVDADAYMVGLSYRKDVSKDYTKDGNAGYDLNVNAAMVNLKDYLPDNYTTGAWYDVEIPLWNLESVLPDDWTWDSEAAVEVWTKTGGLAENATDYATEMYVTNVMVEVPEDPSHCRVAYGIFDADGNIVSAMADLTGGETVALDACAKNEKDVDEEAVMLLAVYNGNVLKEIIPMPLYATALTETDAEAATYTLPADLTGITLKGFIWSDFDSIQPCGDMIEIR